MATSEYVGRGERRGGLDAVKEEDAVGGRNQENARRRLVTLSGRAIVLGARLIYLALGLAMGISLVNGGAC